MRPLLRPGRENAELVALGVGEDHPGNVILTDVGAAGTHGDQTVDLGGLVVGHKIQVETILHTFLLGHRTEQ